ncbi:uncharacterized protein LOC107043563 [Diachasma alloeum]|uniref:uncharacterized protein LOC107043563 n=1 Tax=Diachasma alloeum TaxID=454923 RepID=UPI00073813F6|nr:uncharacterized protein LOC107043563 [Diachasma alloeum]
MTLVSYISDTKKKTCTVLISSMHSSSSIDPETGNKKKPTIVAYYNGAKGAVDTVDQMRGKFNVARASRRWSLTLFFAIMNIVMINSVVIYNCDSLLKMKRKDVIENVGRALTKSLLEIRARKPHILTNVRQLARKCLGLPQDIPAVEAKNRGLCAYYPSRKSRKTISECVSCSELICEEDTIKICAACYQKVIFPTEDLED